MIYERERKKKETTLELQTEIFFWKKKAMSGQRDIFTPFDLIRTPL